MAAKKRRKRQANRGRSGAPRKLQQKRTASARHAQPFPDRGASPAANVSSRRTQPPMPSEHAPPFVPPFVLRPGRMQTALLPGRMFFALGRPISALACCALQVSLLGWVPTALWAFRAERAVANKQRGLAARLRPL